MIQKLKTFARNHRTLVISTFWLWFWPAIATFLILGILYYLPKDLYEDLTTEIDDS